MKKGIIIGAGIGGLTTAIALVQKGIETIIYEQANELNEIGAGIWIAPNGLKVYEKLGLAQEIISSGKVLDKISITDIRGKNISVIDGNEIEAKHNFKTVAIHRAILQKILIDKIGKSSIVLGKRFNSYSQIEENVEVSFEDGLKVNGDFLILSDGIKSKGRLQINPNLKLRYSNQACWRFVTDFNYPKNEDGNMYEIWSNKKGLRVGYSQINSRQVYVYITNYDKAGLIDDTTKLKQNLLQLCDEFPEIVKQIISSVEAENIIRSDIYDFKPISNWVDNNVALLGDAAHATTPNLGQGACQAIEDAYVISDELSLTDNIHTALINYQHKRIPKATFITNTSWQLAKLTNTNGFLKSLIMLGLTLTPKSINAKQFDKIYSIA